MRGSNNHSSSRDRERMSDSSDSSEKMKNTYSAEPEIEHLGAVIESMNTGA